MAAASMTCCQSLPKAGTGTEVKGAKPADKVWEVNSSLADGCGQSGCDSGAELRVPGRQVHLLDYAQQPVCREPAPQLGKNVRAQLPGRDRVPGDRREAGQQAGFVTAVEGEHHGGGQPDVRTQVPGRMPGADVLDDRDQAPVQVAASGVAEHAGCFPAGPHGLVVTQVRLNVFAHLLPGQQEVTAVMRRLVAVQLAQQRAAEDAALVIGGRGEAGRQQQIRLAAGQAVGMPPA